MDSDSEDLYEDCLLEFTESTDGTIVLREIKEPEDNWVDAETDLSGVVTGIEQLRVENSADVDFCTSDAPSLPLPLQDGVEAIQCSFCPGGALKTDACFLYCSHCHVHSHEDFSFLGDSLIGDCKLESLKIHGIVDEQHQDTEVSNLRSDSPSATESPNATDSSSVTASPSENDIIEDILYRLPSHDTVQVIESTKATGDHLASEKDEAQGNEQDASDLGVAGACRQTSAEGSA